MRETMIYLNDADTEIRGLQTKVNAAMHVNDRLKLKIAALETDNEGLKMKVATLEAEKEGLELNVNASVIEKDVLKMKVAALETEIEGLKMSLTASENKSQEAAELAKHHRKQTVTLARKIRGLLQESSDIHVDYSAFLTDPDQIDSSMST